ncbi:MAG TPA: folate-binding protein [Aestuariivirgaceae bacterium]|nr:folate-binding protein [Aestuariivirgaceae bacterium]
MTVSIAVLSRAVLGLEGAEARDFLQSLLTCDVQSLQAGQGAYGALLTPQGKILFDFFTLATETGFLLDAAAGSADDLVKRLTMYRLRRKIEISPKPDLAVAAIWGCDEPPDVEGARVFRDPRAAGLGYRAIGPERALDAAATAEAGQYDAHRIALGIADSERDIGSGQMFPHEANLDQLHGVSFTKGCFVGQEVVSRMEHRGTARSRIVPVRFDGPPPAPETAVTAGGRGLGRILSGHDGRGLALIRLDRATAASSAGEPLVAGDTGLSLERPTWARYSIPAAGGAGDA